MLGLSWLVILVDVIIDSMLLFPEGQTFNIFVCELKHAC
jgi:hypothetical protein